MSCEEGQPEWCSIQWKRSCEKGLVEDALVSANTSLLRDITRRIHHAGMYGQGENSMRNDANFDGPDSVHENTRLRTPTAGTTP